MAEAGVGHQGVTRGASFFNGMEGHPVYRIPAIVSLNRTLFAFAEARAVGHDAGHIDIGMKESRDGGRSWTSLRIVAGEPGKSSPTTYGNPTPIADEDNGALHLIYCVNNTWVFHVVSLNMGQNWTKPKNITAMVKKPSWAWYATGPGHGLKMRGGRLLVPYNSFPTHSRAMMEAEQTNCAGVAECAAYRPPGNVTVRFTVWNAEDLSDPPVTGRLVGMRAPPELAWAGDRSGVFYSDDGGATWALGGQVLDYPGSSEAALVEVEKMGEPELLMSFRVETVGGCRKMVRSADGGAGFQPHFQPQPCIPDPVCHGSLLSLGNGEVLLASGPGSTVARTNLQIHQSTDRGFTFALLREINDGKAAYSDLVEVNKTARGWLVGVLYEDGGGLSFTTFEVVRPLLL